MKKVLLIFALLLAHCFAVTAQTTVPEQEILNQEKNWRTALLNASNDLENIYSKHLSYNDWNGKTHERATLISDVKSGQLKYRGMTARQESVQVYLNTAIYLCEIDIEGNYGETSISRLARILHVWVKEDGTWRLLVHQTRKSE